MLDLSEGIFGDEGMQYLSGLTNLEELNLWSTAVTDAGLESAGRPDEAQEAESAEDPHHRRRRWQTCAAHRTDGVEPVGNRNHAGSAGGHSAVQETEDAESRELFFAEPQRRRRTAGKDAGAGRSLGRNQAGNQVWNQTM